MTGAKPARRGPGKLRVLRKSELAELEKCRSLGLHVIDYYLDKSPKPTPTILEDVCERWRADPYDKVRNLDFAYAFGVLLGDILVAKYDFAWRKRVDAMGETFALSSASTHWETYPIDFVWKRVDPRVLGQEPGFLRAGVDWWRGEVPLRKSVARKRKTPRKRVMRKARK
jgi:hypothetical protein